MSGIIKKFALWEELILENGLMALKQIPGFNDEALLGDRFGQRSSSLNDSYRVIYKVHKRKIIIVTVLEVNKHDY